jgi:hypothetical protein
MPQTLPVIDVDQSEGILTPLSSLNVDSVRASNTQEPLANAFELAALNTQDVVVTVVMLVITGDFTLTARAS